MNDYEKELIFERAKMALRRIEDENVSWNPLNKEQAVAWLCGRRYEAMFIIKALGLDVDYEEWESKQDD